MNIYVYILTGLLFYSVSLFAEAKWLEKDYQAHWCKGEVEVVLEDKSRVDCIQDGYAIEIDWAKKWAEAISQSLFYSVKTGLKPGILLIYGPDDWRHLIRFWTVRGHLKQQGIDVRVWAIRRREE